MIYIVRSSIDGTELYSSTSYVECVKFVETEHGDDDCFIEQLNLFGE